MILTDGTHTVTLPDDMEWSDEYAWAPVVQDTAYTLTGALLVETASRASGRPITLVSGEEVWVSRATVEALRALAAVPGLELTLTLADARVFSVVFRHQDAPAIQADAVMFSAPMVSGDQYTLTLKLMEI